MSAVLYWGDPTDPSDRYDLAYLAHSPHLAGVGSGQAGSPDALLALLRAATTPVSLIATTGFAAIAAARETDRVLFRERVARLFLLGGYAEPHLPIDPRLKARYPERFAPHSDRRVDDPAALGALLTSGEGVIWLPRDICLWRHWDEDEQAAVLLSGLPALCLAAHPEPLPWLRLFRTVPTQLTVDADGHVTALLSNPPAPNTFTVVAIDGGGLNRFLLAQLAPKAVG